MARLTRRLVVRSLNVGFGSLPCDLSALTSFFLGSTRSMTVPLSPTISKTFFGKVFFTCFFFFLIFNEFFSSAIWKKKHTHTHTSVH